MIWILAAIIVSVPAAALLYLACIDGSFRVRRSLEIETSPESAFTAVVNLKSWPEWSPWLIHEPDAKLEYSDDYREEGGFYSWDGEAIGAGKLTHVEIRPAQSIRQQLEFLRPFKAVNDVDWLFERRDDHTLVSWEMSGVMPLLFRFMAKRMEPMIGRDYELGLAMLGGYLNGAMPHPRLEFIGSDTLQDFHYRSIPCNGNLRQLEAARSSSIETLRASAAARIGMSLTLYHRFDAYAGQYQAEIAIPASENMPESNYQLRSCKGGRYFKMTLQGDLKFLPQAWHALVSHCRMYRIKTDPSRPALEIYQQDPAEVGDSNQLVTTLYLPIKQ